MNDDVLLMAGLNLLLCGWVLYLRFKNKLLTAALDGAMHMVIDIADGKAVVEKTAKGVTVRRVENEQV